MCRKWREIALTTSQLWSYIVYKSLRLVHSPLLVFLERSRNAPLKFAYQARRRMVTYTGYPDETHRVSRLFREMGPELTRLTSVVLECWAADTMTEFLATLKKNRNLPCLASLDLSILYPNPTYPSSMKKIRSEDSEDPIGPSSLKFLRLEQIPVSNISAYRLSNIVSLELCFPPRKRTPAEFRHSYVLSMSDLCTLLKLTPHLEDLVLLNTVPFFRAEDGSETHNHGDGTEHPKSVHLVELPALRRLDWSFPYSSDVRRFLSFLAAPSLQKLDFQLEELPNRTEIYQLRGNEGRPPSPVDSVLDLDSVDDLSLQCLGEDSLTSVLRRITVPNLERLEIANVGESNVRPTLPRLESIFRDPRLSHLTHLTLSRLTIDEGHGKAMLGYMPVLVSLSLDVCTRVGILMEGLEERAVEAITKSNSDRVARKRGGVKVCPRLEALTLWGCEDIRFERLRAVVKARNGERDMDLHSNDMAKGIRSNNGRAITGATENGHAYEIGEDPVMTRKIKPLKRVRRQGLDVQDRKMDIVPPPLEPALHNIMVTMIAMKEASRPAPILYIRIDGCPEIGKEEAMSLKDLGVIDVGWSR